MSDRNDIARRWSTNYERGAHDYTDAGCRVLAEHAFRDIAVLLAIPGPEARVVATAKILVTAMRDGSALLPMWNALGDAVDALDASSDEPPAVSPLCGRDR